MAENGNIIKKLINKYKELPVPVKASIWFIICGVFKDAVDVLVTPIFTRILTTEEYGLFNVYNSWYQIFRVFFTFNLCSDVYTVGLAKYAVDKKRYVSSVQGLLSVVLGVMLIIYFAAAKFWAELMGISVILSFFMVLQIISFVPYNAWYQEKRYEYKYKLLTIVNTIYIILQPTLGLLMIKSGFQGFSGGELRIMGTVSVQITFGIVLFVYNFIRKPVFFDKGIWKFSAGMNIPLIPHFLAQILLLQSAKLIIDAFIGKSATAVYSVANSAAFVIQVIVLNLNSAFLPWLYQKLNKNETKGTRSYTTILFLLSSLSVLLIVLVAPEAMSILGTSEYADGVWVIPPLALSVHLMFIYTQFSNIQLYYEKRLRVLVSAIAGTAVCIGLGFIFIPMYGFIAAGYTTMAGYFTIAVLHYIFLHRTCREQNIKVGDLFDIKLVIGMLIGLAVVCGGIALLYLVTPFVRYGLFLAMLVVLFIYRKKLIALFSEFKKSKNKNKEES